MSIHLIGIGERIMRDLATALSTQGHTITNSEESAVDLGKQAIDQVIVGRQVQAGHPALQAVQQQGLPLCSYPEFIYTQANSKQRIVVAGEEKNLTCLLILHVLRQLHKAFDYVVDTPTLATSVQLSDAPIIILEGDVMPSSSIDLQPQSLRYQHHMLLLGTMPWQASTAYPLLETYRQYVTRLADASPKSGTIIYCEEDKLVQAIARVPRSDVKVEAYGVHPHRKGDTQVHLITPQGDIPFPDATPAALRAVAGAHQLMHHLGITDEQFYKTLATFHTDCLI